MPITHAIAHHLQRQSDTPSRAHLRDSELPLEGESETLQSKLKASFLARISREHGSFSTDGHPPLLPTQLVLFLDDELDFVTLSRNFALAFQSQLDEAKIEFDAHLLFFVEKSFDHHLFTLYVARHTEALTLDDALEVTTTQSIDSGPSLFGIKVDLLEWREHQNYAYLSLLPPRGNTALSDAFYQLTGFSNGINKETATLAFLEGVEAYAREMPQEQQKGYRDQVVQYCMEQEENDTPVNMQTLARSIEGVNPDEFVRIVARHTTSDESPQPPEALVVDRRSLRRYVKFAGREKDLAISFSSYQLDERVRYDVESDTLHISGLPTALRKQLLGHLRDE
ncbi:MAG: nucleoid-associated protein [Chromatiales bacterium]|nr:nucleoid-associated protein [Chromatiales bacterium]